MPPKPPIGKSTPPASPAPAPASVPEPDQVPESPDNKRYIILGAVIVVILVVAGVAAFVFWPKPEQLGEPAEVVKVEEAESPRAILDGISKLQESRRAGTGSYTDDLTALVDEAKAGPTDLSPKTLTAMADLVAASNLAGRLMGRGGYEVALRKDEKTWIVLTWSQNSGKQIKPVPSTSGPPFAVVTATRPVAPVVKSAPEPAVAATAEPPATQPAAAPTDSDPAPDAPPAAEPVSAKPAEVETAAPTSAPVAATAAAPKTNISTSRSPTIVIEETKDDGDWVGAKLLLKTSGTMRSGGQYVAIVNGSMVRKGDVVAVTLGGRQYQFKVIAIDTRNVEYEPLNRRGAPETPTAPGTPGEVKFQ